MILDILYTICFLFIGLNLPMFIFGKEYLKYKGDLIKLLIFHFFVGVAYYFFTKDNAGDAWGYWNEARKMTEAQFLNCLFNETSTYFVYALNYIPSKILDMSFFSNTMFFALIGYLGIVFFYYIVLKTIPYNSKLGRYSLFPLLLFIPNLHFWSSGVGKDTLLFFCIGAFAYSMLNILKRLPLLVFSILLSYLIRPHITLFLITAFGLAYLFDAKISSFKRVFFILVLLGAGIAIIPAVMKFASIDNASIKTVDQRLSLQADILKQGSGSAVDMSSYPFPLKVFTFLYRPFFFDVNSVPGLVASFENLLVLVLTFKVCRFNLISTFKAAPFVVKALFFFLIIGTILFSLSLGNIGIMIRMRNMLLPGFLIYILWAFSYQKVIKLQSMKNPLKEVPYIN